MKVGVNLIVLGEFSKTKTKNNKQMDTLNKYPISVLDEMDNIELAENFLEQLPKKDQDRLNYIFNNENEYSDSDYWDEMRKLIYKHFGTTDTLMFAKGIEWDIDEEDLDEVSLPNDVDIWVADGQDIADALSDEYGFCVKSIEQVEIISE
jgi:hypothetical protein